LEASYDYGGGKKRMGKGEVLIKSVGILVYGYD
jgi:hypothetical protein